MLAQAIQIQLATALAEWAGHLRLSGEMLKVQSPKWGLLWFYMGHCSVPLPGARSSLLKYLERHPTLQIQGKLHGTQHSAEGENSFQSLLTSFFSSFEEEEFCFAWILISSLLLDKMHLVRFFILLEIPSSNGVPKLVNRLYLKTQCWHLKSLSLKLGSPSISSPMDSYSRRLGY